MDDRRWSGDHGPAGGSGAHQTLSELLPRRRRGGNRIGSGQAGVRVQAGVLDAADEGVSQIRLYLSVTVFSNCESYRAIRIVQYSGLMVELGLSWGSWRQKRCIPPFVCTLRCLAWPVEIDIEVARTAVDWPKVICQSEQCSGS